MAIPLFQQAVQKDPTNPTYQYHLGFALLKNGEKQKARAVLELVVKNSPTAPEAGDARKALAAM